MALKRYMLSVTEELEAVLEKKLKKRMLDTIPETASDTERVLGSVKLTVD